MALSPFSFRIVMVNQLEDMRQESDMWLGVRRCVFSAPRGWPPPFYGVKYSAKAVGQGSHLATILKASEPIMPYSLVGSPGV